MWARWFAMLTQRRSIDTRVSRPGYSREKISSLMLILAMAAFWITVLGLDEFVRFSDQVHVVAGAVR